MSAQIEKRECGCRTFQGEELLICSAHVAADVGFPAAMAAIDEIEARFTILIAAAERYLLQPTSRNENKLRAAIEAAKGGGDCQPQPADVSHIGADNAASRRNKKLRGEA